MGMKSNLEKPRCQATLYSFLPLSTYSMPSLELLLSCMYFQQILGEITYVQSPPSVSMNDANSSRLSDRQSPVHRALGGGRLADVLLWRDRKASASLLITLTIIWFLFEVLQYKLVPLLCHVSIAMLVLLYAPVILARLNGWELSGTERALIVVGFILEAEDYTPPEDIKLLLYIASNPSLLCFFCLLFLHRNPWSFPLIVACLYILSVIGTYFSLIKILFWGSLLVLTVPFMYEQFKNDRC